MSRTGRPPAQNPKNDRITIRFTREQIVRLDLFCQAHNLDRAEAIRIAVEKMLAQESKQK